MNLRAGLVRVHRWVSLGIGLLWMLQAATGTFAVFHWELDDASVSGAERPIDLAAIDLRAQELAAALPGRAIDSIWTSAGAANRFDIFLQATPPAEGEVVRVDGSGAVLRIRRDGERWARGGYVDTLVRLHQSLFAGERGRLVVGTSGLLLLVTAVAGLLIAWPRRGGWRRALWPGRPAAEAGRMYAWHRALGLWWAAPALLLVSAGVLLAFDATVERWLDPAPVDPPELSMPAGGEPAIGMAAAVERALARFPGAVPSGIGYPTAESAWWAVRLRQPAEPRRAYGKTRVFVSAVDGETLVAFDALAAPASRRFVDALFAIHTGEAGGRIGRLLALSVGLGWLSLGLFGWRLWRARRALQRSARQPLS